MHNVHIYAIRKIVSKYVFVLLNTNMFVITSHYYYHTILTTMFIVGVKRLETVPCIWSDIEWFLQLNGAVQYWMLWDLCIDNAIITLQGSARAVLGVFFFELIRTGSHGACKTLTTWMWNMISSPATPTLCLEQKSESFQSRNMILSMASPLNNCTATKFTLPNEQPSNKTAKCGIRRSW